MKIADGNVGKTEVRIRERSGMELETRIVRLRKELICEFEEC